MERNASPPKCCPVCKKVHNLTEKNEVKPDQVKIRTVGSRWYEYKLIEEAPAVGCGNCGHVVYLTKRPLFSVFYVEESGELIAA